MTDGKGANAADHKPENPSTRKSGRVRFSEAAAARDKDEHQVVTERPGRSRDRPSARAKRSPTPFVRRTPSSYSSADEGRGVHDDPNEDQDDDEDVKEEGPVARTMSLRNRRASNNDHSSQNKSAKDNQNSTTTDSNDIHPLQNDENKENNARPVSRQSSDRFDHIGEFEFVADDFGSVTFTQHEWNPVGGADPKDAIVNDMNDFLVEDAHCSLLRGAIPPDHQNLQHFDDCAEVDIFIYSDGPMENRK